MKIIERERERRIETIFSLVVSMIVVVCCCYMARVAVLALYSESECVCVYVCIKMLNKGRENFVFGPRTTAATEAAAAETTTAILRASKNELCEQTQRFHS